MKRFATLLIGGALALTLATPSSAQRQDIGWQDCLSSDPMASAEDTIEACTYVLRSGHPKAVEMYRADVLFKRGELYLKTGKFDEAIEDLSETITLVPNNGWPYYLRAGAYLQQGDFNAAVADSHRAVEFAPEKTKSDAYNMRAWSLFKLAEKMGDVASAYAGIVDTERAIHLNPKLAEAYDTRAHLFEFLSQYHGAAADFSKAADDYRKALELKPDLQESIDGLKRMGLEKDVK